MLQAGTSEANATVVPVYIYPSAQNLPAQLELQVRLCFSCCSTCRFDTLLHQKLYLVLVTLNQVIAAYTLPNGEPRTAAHTLQLPLGTIARVMPAVKLSNFKFTLEVNKKNPPRLTQLYQDMVADPAVSDASREKVLGQTSNVISFCYHSGLDCTILGSKSGGRFRIQSSYVPCACTHLPVSTIVTFFASGLTTFWFCERRRLETMLLVTADFVRRLSAFFAANGEDDFEVRRVAFLYFVLASKHSTLVTLVFFRCFLFCCPCLQAAYTDPLPLADLFAAADDHFGKRKALISAVETLDNRAHQFRSIQKRLLVRFKDRNSVSWALCAPRVHLVCATRKRCDP